MYLVLKLLHVLAVIAFLGNIATGLFWHAHAARTRDARLLAHAMDGVIRSDRLFTTPAVILIAGTGVVAAIIGNIPILRTGWILGTLLLFVAAGGIFGMRVAPLQRRLRALAQDGASQGAFDYAAYRAVVVKWELWGAAALLTPLAGVVLMVLKPIF
jgi:uncharacterized membrane protein